MTLYRKSTHLPAQMWIVRHGESAGNVARDNAMKSGASRIDISGRDVDVPLSAQGRHQSEALGHWFKKHGVVPDAILSSPYVRAQETAELIVCAGSYPRHAIIADERLREKEFGILDGLTRLGIEQAYPEIATYRGLLGKFYHRPPGGESWCDVILRLRSVLDSLALHYAGKKVLIVTHQVVVLCFRYLLEVMDERTILAIDEEGDVANCAVTEYSCETDKGLTLVRYNHATPLREENATVTMAPDQKAAGP